MDNQQHIKLEIPEKLSCLLERSRYKCIYGGRGSGKSWSVAAVLLVMGYQQKLRILCARETQASIRSSVHSLLGDQINRLGLAQHYDITRDQIRGKNGTQFVFSGLADVSVEAIKSFEGIDICWIEEAQTISDRSWQILVPTIRGTTAFDEAEIWMTFNPDAVTDPTYVRFVANPPVNCITQKINWYDNKWFPKALRDEKDYLYRVDPDAAAHIWDGECRQVSSAQVLRGRYRVSDVIPRDVWDGPYYGADWGFASDPTALVKCWVMDRSLLIEKEVYRVGVDIDMLPAMFDEVPNIRNHYIRADNARPETISYMQRSGFKILAADKWGGSIEDGVEHLRSYEEIIVDPSCKHTLEEARLWSYKVDRLSGDPLPQLKPGHDHIWDAVRYALSPIIRGRMKHIRDEAPSISMMIPYNVYGSWMGG